MCMHCIRGILETCMQCIRGDRPRNMCACALEEVLETIYETTTQREVCYIENCR